MADDWHRNKGPGWEALGIVEGRCVDLSGSLCSHLEYIVKLGDIEVHHKAKTAAAVPVLDIVIHQDYSSSGSTSNDIALALLAFPVNYSTHIQPVCLPEKTFMVQSDTKCWVTGWGKLSEEGETMNQGSSNLRPGKRLPNDLG